MTNRVNRIGLALVSALAIGILMGTIGLLGLDGPPPVSAQADTTAPTISSVAVTSDPDNGVYGIDDTIEVTVTFSEDVTVTGVPRLGWVIGGNRSKTPGYESTSGSTVVFSYTVAEEDSDTDGIAIAANKLTLNDGSIRDAANNYANPAHSAMAAQANHKVDDIKPRFRSLSLIQSSDGSDGFYNVDNELSVRMTFREQVVVNGEPQLTGASVASDSSNGICNRTDQIRVAILNKVSGVSDCSAVTDSDLNGITGSLGLIRGMDSLQAGDFQGLTGVTSVDLNNNNLASLPAGVFDSLGSLENLYLANNDLGSLPEGVFDNLSNLEGLFLQGNSLSELDSDVFEELSSLEHLDLSSNDLTAVDEDLLDGLNSLGDFAIQYNSIETLPNDLFDGLGALNSLDLKGNGLTEVPSDVFDGLDQLKFLYLDYNDLDNLPGGVFDDLDNLQTLDLDHNQMASFPAGVFGGLSSLTHLDMSDNSLTALPAFPFTGLSKLRSLYLRNNKLSSLSGGALDELAQLRLLLLDGNQIGSLPSGAFDGLAHLETLFLANNPGAPFTLTAELEQKSENTIAVKVVRGVPYNISVELSAEEGSLASTTVSIEGGGTNSEEITVTPTDSNQPQVTVRLVSAEFDDPDDEFTVSGVSLAVGGSLTMTVGTSPPIVGNSPATGAPTISGAAQVGETLTADTSGIADADGLTNVSYSYQWLSSRDTEISGATNSSYTLQESDATKTIRVRVSFTDDGGNDESLTSEATDAVVAAPPATDATLSALTLSGVDFSTFDSTTTSYSGQVANSVSQTTVTPTVNHSGASYLIKLAGVTDSDGVVSLAVGSNVITVEVTAGDQNTSRTYTVTVIRAGPPSTDATLSALTMSGIDFGTFASGTPSYSAQAANSVTQTTVAPAVNDSGASYVVKLSGVTDADGVITLSVGNNVITVEVTAEDDSTTRTYTVTVTRAEPPSTDATLSALTLSGVDFGTFDSTPTSYTAQVANGVSQTTVTPTVNHSGASYVIKLGGMEDPDGEISLAVGSNVITVEVTAEDGSTTRTYTVTVTRVEPPSTDANLSSLALSGVNFGTFDSTTTSYTAQVANGVSQTTVTPTVNDSGASYVIKLGGVEDPDGEISLAVGSNVITVEVTAEDGSTTRTYTVTVTRVEPPSTDASLSGLTLSGIDFGTFASGTTSYTAQVANSVTQTMVTPTVNDSGASYVIKLGAVVDADGVVLLSVGSSVITVEVTAEDDSTTRTYTATVTRAEPPTPELSDDVTLNALTLSGIDFGTFDSTTSSYTAQVANSVSQTTLTPTVSDSGASYVVKLGGVEDDDREISLAVGSNVITIEVTAEDGETTRTYTVTVTRVEPPSTDANLSALALSGIDFGTFDSTTSSYTAQVANNVSQTTVTPTLSDSGASYVIKLGAVVDADGVVLLSVGSSVITVEVTAEDDSTTRTYTATVTRAEPPTPELSDDVTLNALTLSGIDFGTFDSTTSSYTAQVANSVSQTTLTPTVSDSGASYVVKLGGVEDDDREISLAVGSNVITIEVTAEDGETTRTYTVTVTRVEPPSTDANLSALALSGIDFGTFDSTTSSYTAQVANSVSQTTVTPTVNHAGASYVIKLDGTVDSDGVIPLSVGSNAITIEVTAENGGVSRVYTVEVTRSEPATPGTSGQRLVDRYDANNNDTIDKNEVLEAIDDYIFGEGDEAISKGDVIKLINLYLFG